jgi:hypothetical protein
MIILKPEILCCPNIPKPLHSVNPRNIMGKEKWDILRQDVYKSTQYHCIACGVHKSEAKKHQWLEAHENVNIDYKKGIVEVKEIVPLCHYCHSFIHSGRLGMILGKEKTRKEVKEILEHGFKVLRKHKLKVFVGTTYLALELRINHQGIEIWYPPANDNIKWNDWKLIYEGKEHKPKFKSYEEWKNNYFSQET